MGGVTRAYPASTNEKQVSPIEDPESKSKRETKAFIASTAHADCVDVVYVVDEYTQLL